MNTAHLHLMVNHLSIVGLGFAIFVTLIALYRKNPEIEKLACWFYILTGLLSVFAILTGDGTGEIVKTYPGISNDAIEYHETWGYVFFYSLASIAALAIAALWFSRKNPLILRKFILTILILALLSIFLAFQTGTTGGRIRHPEIEKGKFNGAVNP